MKADAICTYALEAADVGARWPAVRSQDAYLPNEVVRSDSPARGEMGCLGNRVALALGWFFERRLSDFGEFRV